MRNTQGTHEDFNRVVMGLLGNSSKEKKCFGICGAESQRIKGRSSHPKYTKQTI